MGCFQALEVLKIASGQACILYLSTTLSHFTYRTLLCLFVSLFQSILPCHWDMPTIKFSERFYCNNALCLSDKQTKTEILCLHFLSSAFYLFAIVLLNCRDLSRLAGEHRLALSCPLCCIVSCMLTPGYDASFRKVLRFFPTNTAWMLLYSYNTSGRRVRQFSESFSKSNLSLDWVCQLPAVSSCWCLTLRVLGSGPLGCGLSRLTARCVEKAPVWRSWLTMKLSVGLPPQIRLVIKGAYHNVPMQSWKVWNMIVIFQICISVV